jgi:hypothetical protein
VIRHAQGPRRTEYWRCTIKCVGILHRRRYAMRMRVVHKGRGGALCCVQACARASETTLLCVGILRRGRYATRMRVVHKGHGGAPCCTHGAQKSVARASEAHLADDDPFIVLTETKFSFRYIPVWARYSPLRTRVEAHAITLSP